MSQHSKHVNQILERYQKKHNHFVSSDSSIVTAGVYLRQSTVNRQNVHSVDEQLAFIRQRVDTAQIHSLKFPGAKINIKDEFVFIDHGKTGRVSKGREQYVNFQNALKNQLFQVGLVFDLSRLTRELGSLLDVYNLSQAYDVEVISVSEFISSFDQSSRNSFMFKGMVNEMQSESISRQTKRGLDIRALSGKSTGHVPFGFKSEYADPNRIPEPNEPRNKIIRIHEENAAVVRRIFHLYATTDIGIDGIARILNEEKVETHSPSSTWRGRRIHAVLNQPKYIGIWIHSKTKTIRNTETDKMIQVVRPQEEWIITELPELRIVSQDLWDKVQARMEENAKQRQNSKNKSESRWGKSRGVANHLFSGTMICEECGGSFTVTSGRHGGYYGCYNAHKKKTCKNRNGVRLQWVEAALLKLLKGYLTDSKTLDFMCEYYNQAVKEKMNRIPQKIDELKKQHQKAKEQIKLLIDYIMEGQSSESVKVRLTEKEYELKSLEVQIVNLKRSDVKRVLMTPFAMKKYMMDLDRLLNMKVAQANQLIKRLFPEPMKMVKKKKKDVYEYTAVGRINLSRLIRYSTPVNGAP